MNGFRIWLEVSKMHVWDAMHIMGLEQMAGRVLDEPTLRSRYGQLSMQHHPDRGGTDSDMSLINSAYEVLKDWTGKELPKSKEEQPDLFKKGSPVPEAKIQEVCNAIIQKGFTDYFIRQLYQGYDIHGRIGVGPYGAKGRKGKIPEGTSGEFLFNSIKKMAQNFPILDASIHDYGPGKNQEAWFTWVPRDNSYQSVSFEPPSAKKKKEPGVGMKRDVVENILREKGMSRVGGGAKYVYFGRDGQSGEGYYIRLASKTIRLVRRWRRYSSLEDSGVTEEIYYGQATPEIIDALVNKWTRLINRPNQED